MSVVHVGQMSAGQVTSGWGQRKQMSIDQMKHRISNTNVSDSEESNAGGVRKADVAGLVESEVSSSEQEDDEEDGEDGQFDDNSNCGGRSNVWVRDEEDDIGRSPEDEICNNCNVKMVKAVGGPVVEEEKNNNSKGGKLEEKHKEGAPWDGRNSFENNETVPRCKNIGNLCMIGGQMILDVTLAIFDF
ncbi:hypothetical protein HELRODRAFT_158527 [Helobdella robusta]|uniref:Uncharacterized protein n=1 Tax=Helobdella robusta TaxID=6412 RepID=T1EMX0_HELRO|nr:hypothetical protein HELRODRAFT_158527 [Helobdella robusta]ESO12102.1 hypothetical protein HELRODRAFT_158527 [Helobdella robusta]